MNANISPARDPVLVLVTCHTHLSHSGVSHSTVISKRFSNAAEKTYFIYMIDILVFISAKRVPYLENLQHTIYKPSNKRYTYVLLQTTHQF